MSKAIDTLENVVTDFLSTLGAEAKEALRVLLLNPQVGTSLEWYKLVVKTYLQGPSALRLIEDIGNRYPNEAVWKDLDAPGGQPLFEAGIILRNCQIVLSRAERTDNMA